MNKIELWQECFGDSKIFAENLFSLPGILTLSVEDTDGISSLANLIPVTLCTKTNKPVHGFYVYGVCVAKAQRGKGLFIEIMRQCEKKASEFGKDFLCLIPANERLAKKYSDFGYHYKVKLNGENRSTGDLPISLSNDGFRALVMPAEDTDPIFTHGLLKPLSDDIPLQNFRFADFLGEK